MEHQPTPAPESPVTPVPPMPDLDVSNLSDLNWDRLANNGNYWDQQPRMNFLHYTPSHDLWARLKAAFPDQHYWGYVNCEPHDQYKLIHQAVMCAFEELRKIRYEGGVGTHSEGHAKSFVFKKCLDMLGSVVAKFTGSSIGGSSYEDTFRSVFVRYYERVIETFDPIHAVLTASVKFTERNAEGEEYSTEAMDLTKREKKLLVRAFWPAFSAAWVKFYDYDWSAEFTKFWTCVLADAIEVAEKNRVEAKLQPTTPGELPQ